jgi:hypothetical protein
MSKIALLNVTKSGAEWKGIAPKKVELLEFAELGKARIVVCRNATIENLQLLMQDAEVSTAIKDAWVLVAGGEYCEEFVAWVHPYVTIFTDNEDERYAEHSRGWNIHDDETDTNEQRKCLTVCKDGSSIEVMFGESRENPIGLLSVKCIKD